jgi:hypothetical protein
VTIASTFTERTNETGRRIRVHSSGVGVETVDMGPRGVFIVEGGSNIESVRQPLRFLRVALGFNGSPEVCQRPSLAE